MAAVNIHVDVIRVKGLPTSRMGSYKPAVTVKIKPDGPEASTGTGSGSEHDFNLRFAMAVPEVGVGDAHIVFTVIHKGRLGDSVVGSGELSVLEVLGSSEARDVGIFDKKGKRVGDVVAAVGIGSAPPPLSAKPAEAAAATAAAAAPSPPAAAAPARAAPAAGGFAAPPAYGAVAAPSPAGAGHSVAAAPAARPSAAAGGLELPTVLDGKYTDLVFLGGGAFGKAYRARSLVDDNTYAVKLIPCHTADDLDNIKREAKTLLPLIHDHVVRYFGSFLWNDTSGVSHYGMVMELCDGEDIQSMVTKARDSKHRLNDGIIGVWVYQIASALCFVHSKGVIHRDLKGDNVLLKHGGAKVADFGLATSGSVATAGAAGAYAYESPEQAKGMVYDGKTDVWSLGCMLTEMVTLRFVTERCDSTNRVLGLNPPAVAGAVAETKSHHPFLGGLAERMLQLEPSMRPNAQQIVDELKAYLPGLQRRAASGILEAQVAKPAVAPAAARAPPAAVAAPPAHAAAAAAVYHPQAVGGHGGHVGGGSTAYAAPVAAPVAAPAYAAATAPHAPSAYSAPSAAYGAPPAAHGAPPAAYGAPPAAYGAAPPAAYGAPQTAHAAPPAAYVAAPAGFAQPSPYAAQTAGYVAAPAAPGVTYVAAPAYGTSAAPRR